MIKTLEEYLTENKFLQEAADFHLKLERDLSNVAPLDLPSREKILELVKAEKIPLLQQEKFQAQILNAAVFCGKKIYRLKKSARKKILTKL